VPCSASRVVPGAHRVVGPGTHRGSGPREVHTTLTLPPSPKILAFASIKPQGLGGFSSSPALLVAPIYEHHGALQYSATGAPLLGVWPTAGTRINLVSHCCLASAIERPISVHLLVSVGTTFRTDKTCATSPAGFPRSG
jgi:hypothetical protein